MGENNSVANVVLNDLPDTGLELDEDEFTIIGARLLAGGDVGIVEFSKGLAKLQKKITARAKVNKRLPVPLQ